MSPPWMPLYIGDYIADTGHLRTIEHGAYVLLIMHYWRRGGLPIDDRKLARIARMSTKEWNSARSALEALFEDSWTHKRIDFELQKASQLSESSRRGGIASGIVRKRKSLEKSIEKTNDPSTTVQRPSKGLRTIREPSQSPSQLQKEEEDKKETRASALALSDWPPDYREQFWQAFPNKVGKADAVRKLDKVATSGVVAFTVLMAALHRYGAKTDDRPWCNPATWLNQQRWTDEPAAVRQMTLRDQQQQRSDDAVAELSAYNRRRSRPDSGEADSVLPEDPGRRPKDLLGGPGGTLVELSELGAGAHPERGAWDTSQVQVFACDKRNQGNGGSMG